MANMNHWMPGGVGGLIVWGGIILFAGLLLRSLPGRRRDPPSDPETPLEILKRRYAGARSTRTSSKGANASSMMPGEPVSRDMCIRRVSPARMNGLPAACRKP